MEGGERTKGRPRGNGDSAPPERGGWGVPLAVGGAVAVGFALRAWALWARGVVDYDETYYYMLGRSLVTGGGYTLNGLPHAAFPPLYPLLVGLASLCAPGIRLATSGVSALAGALLPIPVYFLARDVHGRRAGVIAAAAAAVWPSLAFLAAGGVPYASRLYVGTEPLYVTLVAAGMAALWAHARHGGLAKAAAGGAFFALASLARSEGPVAFGFAFAWLAAEGIVFARKRTARSCLGPAVAAAAMIVVFLPWLIYLHGATGHWTLGAKLTNKVQIRKALWQWAREDDDSAFMSIHYALSSDATEMEQPYWGITERQRARMTGGASLESGAAAVLDPDFRWLPMLYGYFRRGTPPLVPLAAWVFIAAGLLMPPWNAARLRWWGLFAAAAAPLLLIAVSMGILPRNVLSIMPFMAAALGKGLDGVASLLERAPLGRLAALLAALPAAAVLAAMAVTAVRANVAANRMRLSGPDASPQRLEREAAEEVGRMAPPGATLMVMKPWLAVWSGLEWRVTPLAGEERMARYALARGIDYGLLEAWQFGRPRRPQILARYLVKEFEAGRTFYLIDFRRLREDVEARGVDAVLAPSDGEAERGEPR